MGQIVGRILATRRIAFTALDRSPAQIAVVRRFGGKVYFGDPARPDVLRAAGAETARVIVVVPDEVEETLRIVETATQDFPHLVILARARDRQTAHVLKDRGVARLVRETFFSSLKLAEMALEELDVPTADARRTIEIFAEYDERLLAETQAIYMDERQLIQTTQQAAEELAVLLEADREQS